MLSHKSRAFSRQYHEFFMELAEDPLVELKNIVELHLYFFIHCYDLTIICSIHTLFVHFVNH